MLLLSYSSSRTRCSRLQSDCLLAGEVVVEEEESLLTFTLLNLKTLLGASFSSSDCIAADKIKGK